MNPASKAFDSEGYVFVPELSDAKTWLFRRDPAAQ